MNVQRNNKKNVLQITIMLMTINNMDNTRTTRYNMIMIVTS